MSSDVGRAQPSVVVMTRAPLPGATKTRLAPLLGHDSCARVHYALIQHTLGAVTDAVGAQRVLVAVDPPGHLATVDAIIRPIAPRAELIAQVGDDLGERMAAASAVAHSRHRGPVVVVGTDLPTLTAAIITEAIGCVDAGCDAVFGPAVDGGYYLIGLAAPTPQLFALPPGLWGGSEVLAASMALAAAAGLQVAHLAPLRDLDTPADLTALIDEGQLPASVAAAVSGSTLRLAVQPDAQPATATRQRSGS